MNILVLTKRQYMSRDLIDDRYGRFRELPLALARRGHDVRGLTLSYRPRGALVRVDTERDASVEWHSVDLTALVPGIPGGYWSALQRLAARQRPGLVLVCSDAPHAILGWQVAAWLRVPWVLDLYDNFESYGLTRWLRLGFAFRRAVLHAGGVACISRPLAARVIEEYGYRGPVEVIENAVPPERFYPRGKVASRAKLGLPPSRYLIGTAGALSRTRGIGDLFAAFQSLLASGVPLSLVIAGPRDKSLGIPTGPHVHDFGPLAPERVPELLSALDLAVICNRDDDFGRYCFPQKLYEAVSCGVPIVAANIESLKDLLALRQDCLYPPGDAVALAERVRAQLQDPRPLDLVPSTWDGLAGRLESLMGRALEDTSQSRRRSGVSPL